MTESARYAHVVLPTTAFGEERVSFTSTERRIQLAERVIDPPAGPMPAWEQLTRLAQALGTPWNYDSSADVMREIGQAVAVLQRGQPRKSRRAITGANGPARKTGRWAQPGCLRAGKWTGHSNLSR